MNRQPTAPGPVDRLQLVSDVGHRIGALARGEALLLRRSPVALLSALALPAAVAVSALMSNPNSTPTQAARMDVGVVFVATLAAFALLTSAYYNLVTAVVARREELVLKRLRTGECGDAEILIAAAVPHIAIAWAQIALGIGAAAVGFGLPLPVNAGLVIVGVMLGTAVLALLAVLSTTLTRTVELAQITTMPVLIISFVFSGLIPLQVFPGPVQRAAELMPLTAVTELVRLGLSGTTGQGAGVGFWGSFGPALVPVLVLVGWTALAGVATAQWFRWEPRR